MALAERLRDELPGVKLMTNPRRRQL